MSPRRRQTHARARMGRVPDMPRQAYLKRETESADLERQNAQSDRLADLLLAIALCAGFTIALVAALIVASSVLHP